MVQILLLEVMEERYVALSEFLQALSEFVHLLFLNLCW
jgi:hypothetical protein